MLTLPNTLDDFLNKCISIHIIEYHELGHAKAICKVIKKNPNLSNVKPIILIGDYRTSLESTSAKSVFIDVNNIDKVDEDKRIIYFKPSKGHTKGHTKGITLHPDFAKMSNYELIKCLCAGFLYELPIYFLLDVVFVIASYLASKETNATIVYYFLLIFAFGVPIFFISQILISSDLKALFNLDEFRQSNWSALYDLCDDELRYR